MSEFQRQQKQKYLRQNILEKQYDPEEFMDFCQNYKANVDIDSWTINELKDIVKSFIQSKKSSNYQFSHFQVPSQSSSPKKQNSNDWANFQMNIPKVQTKKQVDLTSIDLDFLEMMGMDVSAAQKKQKPKQNQPILRPQQNVNFNKAQFTSISNNIKKPQQNPVNQELLKQLQNQKFISAFNLPVNKSNVQQSSLDPFVQIQKPFEQKETIESNKQISQQSQNSPNFKKSEKQSPLSGDNKVALQNIIKSQKESLQTSPDEEFVTEIKCKQISKNKLPADSIICRIVSHQIINPNVFVPNFVMYTISTAPMNVEVKRRMKDFEELRVILKKLFPTTQIPFLQRFSRLSQTQPQIITKQKAHLQCFLNSLLMNPVLKCRILQDFLLCTDLVLVKKIFRQLDKADKPKAIEDLWTTTGFVKLNTKTATRKYMSQQQLYIDFVENSFTKLKTLYDQLTIHYQNISKTIEQIANVFDQLKQTTKIVNENFQENLRFKTFQPILGQVTELHRHLSEAMQRQSKNVQTELKNMFKYQISNISTVKENMKTLTNIYEAYEKRNDKEAAKREAYESKKLQQYKVGAQLPSKNITVLKYQSAYAQNQFRDQLCRYVDELTSKIGTQFEIFCSLQMSIAGDMDFAWRNFQKFVEKR